MTYLELIARMCLIVQNKHESHYLVVATGMVQDAVAKGEDIRGMFFVAPQHEVNKALYCARNNPVDTLALLRASEKDIYALCGLLPGFKRAIAK